MKETSKVVGGSKKGRAAIIERDREWNAKRLYTYYSSDEPTNSKNLLERRFWVSSDISNRICSGLEKKYKYVKKRNDATGKEGFTERLKRTAVISRTYQSAGSQLVYEVASARNRPFVPYSGLHSTNWQRQ